MPNASEIRAGWENLKAAGFAVDYIVTHEPPPGINVGRQVPISENYNQLEAFLAEVLRKVRYKKWFFGARHIDREITGKNYAVFSRVVPVEENPHRRKLFQR